MALREQKRRRLSTTKTLILYHLISKKRNHRDLWVHPLNEDRHFTGEHLKVDRMYNEFPRKFFEYTRLSPKQFDTLLDLLSPVIAKQDTTYRQAIPPRVRLYVTLRFLATGDQIRTIATSFSMGRSTVWYILSDCLTAIWEKLGPLYMAWPQGDDWNDIMEAFDSKWQFPNLLAAIDGKHVVIQKPARSGSLYLNYKGTFSVVLMAMCDAEYRFLFIDVGGYGKQSDGGVLYNSSLGKLLREGRAGLPTSKQLPASARNLPCVIVGDEAFGLAPYMMKPYSGKTLNNSRRIFNYRLSRARRTIENAFGIMATRFRVFRRVLSAAPLTASKVVMASCVLHNFIKNEEEKLAPNSRMYCPPGYADNGDLADGRWREEPPSAGLIDLQRTSIPAQERYAKLVREEFQAYFNNEGAVSWQNSIVDSV